MTALLLALTVTFNVAAQLIIKHAAGKLSTGNFSLAMVQEMIKSPLIWVGAMLYGMSFLLYTALLAKNEISRMSPTSQALTTTILVFISIMFFRESLTLPKVIGVGLLVLGTVVVNR